MKLDVIDFFVYKDLDIPISNSNPFGDIKDMPLFWKDGIISKKLPISKIDLAISFFL